MADLIKPDVSLPETENDDPRIGGILGRDPARPRAVLIGFPSDEGVRRNGGRQGARQAPDAVRRAFFRLTPDAGKAFRELLESTHDAGNLRLSGDLEEDQEALGEVVGDCLARGLLPVLLGGGHETAYGHFLGYVRAGLRVAILNWDAHADVRPLRDGKGHSGSPFRQALLHPSAACRSYTAAGLLPYCVSPDHADFVRERGGRVVWRDEIQGESRLEEIYASLEAPALVSFDLDAVDQSQAPGVSAPAAGGLSGILWLRAAFEAGRTPAVTSMDLVELSPPLDRDEHTTRLAALTLWYFFKGLSARPAGSPR